MFYCEVILYILIYFLFIIAQQSLQTLLDNLLDLQFCLMEKRPETQSNETSSNIEDDSTTTDIGFSDQFPQWVGSNGERCYESYIAKMHERFQPYRDTILDKWNTKLQLSTGKLTNKVWYIVVLTTHGHFL